MQRSCNQNIIIIISGQNIKYAYLQIAFQGHSMNIFLHTSPQTHYILKYLTRMSNIFLINEYIYLYILKSNQVVLYISKQMVFLWSSISQIYSKRIRFASETAFSNFSDIDLAYTIKL